MLETLTVKCRGEPAFEDGELSLEDGEEVRRLLALHHPDLHGRPAQAVVKLNGLERSRTLLVLGRVRAQPVVDQVLSQ